MIYYFKVYNTHLRNNVKNEYSFKVFPKTLSQLRILDPSMPVTRVELKIPTFQTETEKKPINNNMVNSFYTEADIEILK